MAGEVRFFAMKWSKNCLKMAKNGERTCGLWTFGLCLPGKSQINIEQDELNPWCPIKLGFHESGLPNQLYIYTYQFDSGRCSPHKCCPLCVFMCVSKHAGYDNTTIIWHSVLFNGWYLTSVRAEKSFQVCPLFLTHPWRCFLHLPPSTDHLWPDTRVQLDAALGSGTLEDFLGVAQVPSHASVKRQGHHGWTMVKHGWLHGSPTHTHTCSELSLRILLWSASDVQKQSSYIWQEQEGVWCGVKGKFFRRHLEEWNKINRSQEEPHNISRKLQWTRDSPQPQSVSFV